jgi:mannose-1-phosphate guanylyltransferase
MYAVIMAGGSGTRFWPLSREKMPKQLLKIGGEDTLIRQTVGRMLPLIRIEDIFIVTNQSLADTIGHQLSSKFEQSWDGNFILEPEAKNTAPALGLAALHLERLDPESIMVVLAADHFIRKAGDFLDLIRKAGEAARHGYMVTLGIKPDRPETGYGYIKAGERVKIAESIEHGVKTGNNVHRVEKFVEKPDVQTAREYLKNGSYYWNSGIFVWKTKTLLSEIEKHHPSLHKGLSTIRRNIGTDREADVIKDVFKKLESISIDYAVMEKTDKAASSPLTSAGRCGNGRPLTMFPKAMHPGTL